MLWTLLLLGCGSRTPLEADNTDGAPPKDSSLPECGDETIQAGLHITADDQFRLFVDGKLVDQTPRKWWDVQTYDVTLFRWLKNTIAIEGTNMWSQNGTDRGIIADLRFMTRAGEQHVMTTAAWRLSTTLVGGWETPSLEVSAWKLATSEGKNGIKPYGLVLGPSRAEWLWSYDSNGPTATKPDVETIWIRHDFFVDATGHVSDAPGTCP